MAASDDPRSNANNNTAGANAALFSLWCNAQLKTTAVNRRATRSSGAGAGFDAEAFEQANLLEVQFADGSVYYTDPKEFAALHPERSAARGAAAAGGRVQLSFDLAPAANSSLSTRGGSDAAVPVEQYRLAKLTEPTTLDKLYEFGALFGDKLGGWFGAREAPAAGALAGKLCRAFENGVLDTGVGAANSLLLWWDSARAGWYPVADDVARLPQHTQALLLLHGTASSTQGSFSGLWAAGSATGSAPADPEQVGAEFARLAQSRLLLAFEHRSLTVSPLLNVIELLEALRVVLPANCELSLLSHSRGGLVGELLCPVLGAELSHGARESFVDLLRRAYLPEDNTAHPDAARLAEYGKLLGELGGTWRIGSFVRVACPARGTLLADRRTDLFLSLLLRSVGLAVGGIANPWFEALQGLVRALVASRAQASALPGLEAMIPGAPLSRALNSADPSFQLPGKLRVVAGDSMKLGWGGLLSMLGDVFYGLHDHDFVVHTHSMFGGLLRADAKSLRVEDKSVTHFGYFKPGALTRAPILAALAGVDSDFRTMSEDEAITRGLLQVFTLAPLSRWPLHKWLEPLQAKDAERKPILVVLPGIMGSELAFDAGGAPEPKWQLAWLSLQALLNGDLGKINLQRDADLTATALMAVAYERLLKQARDRFHVVTFPFDWRKPLPDAGDALFHLLNDQLLPQAQRLGKPLHILAHSMGGLVARSALFYDQVTTGVTPAQRAKLWADIAATDGRLLMLGTPNQGSYAPVQLLLQQHATASLVAMAASQVSAEQLAQWGASFAGLLSMLPAAPDPLFGDLFKCTTWAEMRRADANTALPDVKALEQAVDARRWLNASFDALKKDPRVLYVAGQGATPKGLKRIQGAGGPGLTGSVLRLGLSNQGDGTVPWDSVLLPERTWYVACSHGDLPDRTEAFAGYFELLAQGRSSLLSQQPPTTRAIDNADAVLELPALPSLPADPAAFLLGVTRRPSLPRWAPPIEVRVVHASLDYARYPLMVGHYQNDSLLGAVQRVNQKLNRQLQRMVDLKLFVGAARTTAYLRPPTTDAQPPAYPGGVVLGLGAVGELTPASLAHTVTRGVLRYAFEHAYQDAWVARDGPLELRLSTLLIGTHVQAVGIRDSLASVLDGVWRASQLLSNDSALARSVRVAEVEVVEIDENTALDAAYQLSRLLSRSEWAPRFRWQPATLETRDGGLRGFRASDPDSIWQRLVVGQDDNGGLKFELIAERARVESTRVHAAVASLTDYIARVSDAGATGAGDSDEQASLGRVLYQLLLPQALKARLANFEQTVLVLDDAAAALPWELLTPPVGDSLGQEAALPLAVQAGMVRQRVTAEFRSLPSALGGLDALVIGAPLTDGWTNARGEPLVFADLPGAEIEARRVALLLGAAQWQVKLLPSGSGFERVRTALYERSWRVLHLCGHGVVDQWVADQGLGALRRPLLRTGMVLSHQQVLSAGDVEQMDPTPEFVFINCCYSGRDGSAGRAEGVHRNDPTLASSLAMQFIGMGAKAVVAAGWQVEDADGVAFAESLYTALLGGQAFGDAVREARQAVFSAGGGTPRSNTWGAYQCYGDPQWRLIPLQQSGAQGSGVLADAHRCMSKHELAARILQVVAIAGDKPSDVLIDQLDKLVEHLRADPDRREWLRSSRVRAAFGEAYRELGAHLKALTWLQRGAKTAYSRMELRHLELGVNSLSRLLPDELPANAHAGHNAAAALLKVLEALDGLDSTELGLEVETKAEYAASAASERMCLRGSDQVRQAAQLLDNKAASGRLLYQAARCYTRGYIGKVRRSDLIERQAFALSSALVAGGLAVLVDPKTYRASVLKVATSRSHLPDWQAVTTALLDEMERAKLGATFWHYTSTLDLLLARQVLALALDIDVPGSDLQRVGDLLDRALVRWPAPVEVESMVHRMDLIARVLRLRPAPKGQLGQRHADLLATVDKAVAKLATYRAGPPAGD